jgi:hypothetical protein
VQRAELVFANVLDGRHLDAEGETGQPFVYSNALGGRALPFAVVRHWKAPQGYVTEHFQLIAPSGRVSYASEARTRRMPGQMDLARITDVVRDAIFHEMGIYAASFLIEGEIQAQTDFQVVLQAAPQKLPKEVEDSLRKSDVIWVGIEANGRDRAVPVWFVYRQGRIYVLHSNEGSGEQVVPGLPDASELVVVTRMKYRDSRTTRFPASVRLIPPESPEFDQVAAPLADRRRDRHIPPADLIRNWRSASCLIAELTPTIPA